MGLDLKFLTPSPVLFPLQSYILASAWKDPENSHPDQNLYLFAEAAIQNTTDWVA